MSDFFSVGQPPSAVMILDNRGRLSRIQGNASTDLLKLFFFGVPKPFEATDERLLETLVEVTLPAEADSEPKFLNETVPGPFHDLASTNGWAGNPNSSISR